MLTINKEIKVHESHRKMFVVRAEGYFGDGDEAASVEEYHNVADDAEFHEHLCKVSSIKFEDNAEKNKYIIDAGFNPTSFYIPIDNGDMCPRLFEVLVVWIDKDGYEHDVKSDGSMEFLAGI